MHGYFALTDVAVARAAEQKVSGPVRFRVIVDGEPAIDKASRASEGGRHSSSL